MSISKHPYLDSRPPVVQTIGVIEQIIAQYPDKFLCLYLAHKTPAEWDKSTSRVYMNQVSPNLIYLPVNVTKEASSTLTKILDFAKYNPRVAGVNITQPHKNSPAIQDYLHNDNLVDTLFKDRVGNFIPKSLNAIAFWEWYQDEVGAPPSNVVIIGVGGVGFPTLIQGSRFEGVRLYAVDIDETIKSKLQSAGVGNILFTTTAIKINIDNSADVLVINASGKEGAGDSKHIRDFIDKYKDKKYIFVDMRPQLNIDIVDYASNQGWRAHTGNGMNEYNDYTLLKGLLSYFGEEPISFRRFNELVKKAS